jgi:hypothetical protein
MCVQFLSQLEAPIVHSGHMVSMSFLGEQFAAAVRPLFAVLFALMTGELFDQLSPTKR